MRTRTLLAVTTAAAIAITVIGPNHNDLQLAASADRFRAELDEPGRHLAAGAIDILFAVAYGTLGFVELGKRAAGRWFGRAAQVLVVVGATADVIENLFLLRNIAARATVSDGWIDAMQVPGTVKWVAAPGFLLLFWLVGRDLLHRR